MKKLKYIFFAVITTTILSCADNSTEPELILSNESLAGNYDIAVLDSDIETSTIVANIPVTVANASLVGDTFQVDVVINADGTFTAGGQYRIVSTITPVGSPQITETEIITVEPSSGSYILNSLQNTVTFMSQDAGLLEGTFNVIVFNETTFTLNQQIEETLGDLTLKINVNLSLERK
ncbi:MAG: hypothetical protein P8M14_03255 [Flavobacteriaceae bacterium]|nr:hypothetical protein [Flavobacteriaceae bacterium]